MEGQSIALYGREIEWKNQKIYQNEVQNLINRQTCSIKEIYLTKPIATLISESGLISVHIMLVFWQSMYFYHLFSPPESIPTKNILSITIQIRDKNTQVEV